MQLIENPRTGETIRILDSGRKSGILRFELTLEPGGKVPAPHRHPGQAERFEVLEGRVRFRIGLSTQCLLPGQSVTVSRGRSHSFANAGGEKARLLVETTPALKMEDLLRQAPELSALRRGRLPWALARFLKKFEQEIEPPYIPRRISAPLLRLAARLAGGAGREGIAS